MPPDEARSVAPRSTAALDELFARPQFSIPQIEKEALLARELSALVARHRRSCEPYRKIMEATHAAVGEYRSLALLPFLPVSLFKSHLLASVPNEEVFKTMTSSGTSGSAVSRVILDRSTAELQSRALAAIMTRVLGARRSPMIIIDTPNVVRDRTMFSARGAGVLGVLPFGREHFYALDDQMKLDIDGLLHFLGLHAGQRVLLFGFTFMVWKYFLGALADANVEVDLSEATLLHSGGWKKLADEAVTNAQFKDSLKKATGLGSVHNFYGMVEQVGSVFLEGHDGFLYPPNFADVIIRDPDTWQPAPVGVPGVVEVLSVLPRSYPGHVLLTEDLGVVHGIGSAESGWAGKQLEILGRVPRSELRGCSDTHAFDRVGP